MHKTEKPGNETQVQVKNIYRLTNQQYMELEKKALTKGQFRDDSSAEHLGVIVGIEHVLRLVREGFTLA